MKHILGVLVLLIGLLFLEPTLASAQEFGDPEPPGPELIERKIHLRRMELELQKQQAELEHERALMALELDRQRAELEHWQHKHGKIKDKLMPLFLICLIVHILVAIWVFQDIRIRNAGSGIWIVVALLAGLPGVLVYAVVRLGDVPKST